MKRHSILIIIAFALLLFSCNSNSNTSSLDKESSSKSGDQEQIKNLVIQVYKWKDADFSKNDLFNIAIEKDSLYIGMDLNKQRVRMEELRQINFFTEEFLENYNKIVLTIDKKLRNKEYEWLVGDMPPFGNDADPWCNCQDYPYDNPWEKLKFTFNELNKDNAKVSWTWGETEWSKNFKYTIKAKKINGKWMIAYMEGFDFEKMTGKNY